MPRQHCQRSPKHAARQCEVVTIRSPRLLIVHEIKGHWQGRRSGYPFSGPRSRCTGLANLLWLINAVFGSPTLSQAQMGPAPGHPNHLPSGGHGAAGAARLFAICQEPLRLFRCAPPCSSRWAVGFAGAGPIRGCPPGSQPITALTQKRLQAKGRNPRAWAGERKPRRPPARSCQSQVQVETEVR